MTFTSSVSSFLALLGNRLLKKLVDLGLTFVGNFSDDAVVVVVGLLVVVVVVVLGLLLLVVLVLVLPMPAVALAKASCLRSCFTFCSNCF